MCKELPVAKSWNSKRWNWLTLSLKKLSWLLYGRRKHKWLLPGPTSTSHPYGFMTPHKKS